jgi:hypothetical protein
LKSIEVQIGMLVRVSERHSNVDYRGQTGMVQQRYGDVNYAAFDVQFGGGRSDLFWHHELEEAQEFH